MTAEAAIWTPELWTPGIGWRPKSFLPKISLPWYRGEYAHIVKSVSKTQLVIATDTGGTNLLSWTISAPASTSLCVVNIVMASNTLTGSAPTQLGGGWTQIQANAGAQAFRTYTWAKLNPTSGTTVTSALSGNAVAVGTFFEFAGYTGTQAGTQAIGEQASAGTSDYAGGNLSSLSHHLLVGHAESLTNSALLANGAPWVDENENITAATITYSSGWQEFVGSSTHYSAVKNGVSMRAMAGLTGYLMVDAKGSRAARLTQAVMRAATR